MKIRINGKKYKAKPRFIVLMVIVTLAFLQLIIYANKISEPENVSWNKNQWQNEVESWRN